MTKKDLIEKISKIIDRKQMIYDTQPLDLEKNSKIRGEINAFYAVIISLNGDDTEINYYLR